MTLTQLDLALILTALHTERGNAKDDEWLYGQLTALIERVGRALAATQRGERNGEDQAGHSPQEQEPQIRR